MVPVTMKALIKSSEKGLQFSNDVSVPAIGPRDVLVKVITASICGSDLHIYKNDTVFRDRVVDGRVTGHEFCGEIIEIGSQVTTLAKGDIISAESHVACGSCYYCLNGAPNVCQEVSAIGFDRPGGFAQYTVLPAENAILVPDGISYDVAACLEPFGNAVYTARCVDLVNKVVWVTGCGPQGLMAIAVAKASGARIVIATEMKKERQELAWTMLRAHANPREKNLDQVIDPNDPELLNQIYDLTQGLGVDVILEMSGSAKAISDGLLALRRGGHVVALGLSSAPRIDLDWNNGLVMKEAVIRGIYGRMLFQTWTEVHHMLVTGKVNLEPLLYPRRFSLEEFQEGFDLLLEGRAAKIIFYPNGAPSGRK